MKRIHIVGRKNSGKTTLIVELVQQLRAMGFIVGTIKHTHHRHELDVPGKDSFRHREAGAVAVGILSPSMNAVFWPGDSAAADARDVRYVSFDPLFLKCDVILVEGDAQTTAPKIEVWRPESAQLPLVLENPSIHAVVSDAPVDVPKAVWRRSEVPAIAEKLLALIQR
ncbi:MAG: molybdopterin-guanine dinucleotide biosynthesis protein B [Planctomycetaceae bacterium]|nr:molybdopterin-guanine dinucleotide biosynthesis protein B [Planctomycetaceae bacterium]